ncbi:MAG TPA: sigma-54-dependent Fis family transcriptional regulator [Nitrospirae bacterium]|nr:sigma-54-dependent Fis family transcriptional regulator [Nitrospirota bacterium]
MKSVLIIDDDITVRDVLNEFLISEKYRVALEENGLNGLERLRKESFDIIFLDLAMPVMGGMDVLKAMKDTPNSDTPCIIITAYGTVKNAVEAMRTGAFDYVTKPFRLDELGIIIQKALDMAKLKKENIRLKRELRKRYEFHGLIGSSPKMQRVYDLIEKIADTDSTVLITGGSGTGKELIAKVIHYNSYRSGKNFVPLNCAAIPKDLLESELFGHEKGAFTGAINTRIGRFELASGGTLFLDEIGELDPSLQVKLLRVLQEREFERIGSTKTIKVNVRILAATNRNLEELTREGRFREDLYYRLNVIPVHIPPLRDRKEDIPVLIEHFLKKHAKAKKRQSPEISKQLMDVLLRYGWPGNIRELENLIERLTILTPGQDVTMEDLPERFQPLAHAIDKPQTSLYSTEDVSLPPEGINLNDIIDTMERKLITEALEKSNGIKSKAATLLGLNRTTLVEKMKKKGIAITSKV